MTDVASPTTEPNWNVLVTALRNGRCTPFVGAGISQPHLPKGADLARELAGDEYPFGDAWNLPRVAQYLATTNQDATFVKQQVIDILKPRQDAAPVPEIHTLLADLKQPLYLTTNYDVLLERAIAARGRTPTRTTCRWNDRLERNYGTYPKVLPSKEAPEVFHLHGELDDVHSLLLTEDDYIDFTVSLARRSETSRKKEGVIPTRVRSALADTALLFVGYSLNDWNFRVLMRYIVKTLALSRTDLSPSVSIQLEPDELTGDDRRRAMGFLAKYLNDSSGVTVHWRDATEFLTDLAGHQQADGG